MAWDFHFPWATGGASGKNTNYAKDFADSVLAGVTGQTPAWRTQQNIQKTNDFVKDADRKLASLKRNTGHSNNATNNQDNLNQTITTYDPVLAQQAAEDQRAKELLIGNIDEQIRAMNSKYGNLDTLHRSNKTYINDAYDKGKSRLNQQQSTALSKLATQRGDTQRDFQGGIADNDANARNLFNALQSMLSRAGSGSSSASRVLTPFAVSNDASRNKAKIADTYGVNMRNLRTVEDDTKTQYKNNLDDLGDNRDDSLFKLDTEINSQRSEVQNQLARLKAQLAQAQGGDWKAAQQAMKNHTRARDALDKTLASLRDKYRNPYTVKDIVVKEAALNNYALDPSGISVNNPNGPGHDTDTSPEYLAKLKEEEEKKNGAFIA